MELRVIRSSRLPGAGALFSDYLSCAPNVREFFPRCFQDSASFSQASAEIRFPAERRAALVAALAAQNGPHPALDLLARPDTCVVATGQQVGLFTGPAYSVYKALTAVKLARRLTDQGLPAVPVFWLATEDHDFDEAGHCWVFDADCQPVRIDSPPPASPNTPVGKVPVAPSAIEAFQLAVDGLPFAAEAVRLVSACCDSSASFGDAFRDLLKRLLPADSLLFLDPLAPEIRRLSAPFLADALVRAGELVRLVLQRNQELEKAGYHAQVRVDPQSTLFFLLEQGQRLPIRAAGASFSCERRRFSIGELSDRAADLSPNALLRPVMQDYLLPTVAAVLGPAEIAYFAQSQVLYQALLGRMPVVFPRAGFTVLDRRSADRADRYGLTLPDLWLGEAPVQERIAACLVPPELHRATARAKDDVEAALERLRVALASFDPTLAEALERSRRKMLYQLWRLERKSSSEALRRNERAAILAARLSSLAAPHRRLQERVYSILALVARHGPELLPALDSALDLGSPDHRLLVL